MARQYLSSTADAARVFGLQLVSARRQQRRTSTEVAERAGITRVTLSHVEHGEPSVAIGIYFEVAAVLALPLFGAERSELAELAARGEKELALLPRRVRRRVVTVDDNF
ncbi:MAG: helix-turn-helix domain-containing protein [Actinobacteria bacterium]|uniref:Unannotated protein n=1 Tax=freshwater metagenome TaxID=449393 RepID=A0A6J7M1H8_9ZZZZ|nr:helix-turn-helix domain-containing protein [Actinomycetota bacterium]MSX79185.1 helix-turn-helix domain-containing protein [Actinomycetota bacterium]